MHLFPIKWWVYRLHALLGYEVMAIEKHNNMPCFPVCSNRIIVKLESMWTKFSKQL